MRSKLNDTARAPSSTELGAYALASPVFSYGKRRHYSIEFPAGFAGELRTMIVDTTHDRALVSVRNAPMSVKPIVNTPERRAGFLGDVRLIPGELGL